MKPILSTALFAILLFAVTIEPGVAQQTDTTATDTTSAEPDTSLGRHREVTDQASASAKASASRTSAHL